jgi:hypothetical protein
MMYVRERLTMKKGQSAKLSADKESSMMKANLKGYAKVLRHTQRTVFPAREAAFVF